MNTLVVGALGLLSKLVESWLQNLAQGLWNSLWEQIFAAVVQAEKSLSGGNAKRSEVVAMVMDWVRKQAPNLGWFEMMVIQAFVGLAVDAIVQAANTKLGHGWLDAVVKAEESLANVLPLVEPAPVPVAPIPVPKG